MLFILKIVFLFIAFFIAYSAVEYIYFKNNKRVKEARGEYKIRSKSTFDRFKRYIEKNDKAKNVIERKDEKLKKLGNPLKINGFSYYVYKFFMLVMLILFTISGEMSFSTIVILAVITIFPDVMIKSISQKEKAEILGDLPNITDILNIQSGAAGMDMGIALMEAFSIAKCRRLKEKLMELSIEISLTKNIPAALDKFASNFNLAEIDSLVIALKQAVITGKSRELLDSQSELLKDAALTRISLKTKEVGMWIGLVGGLFLLGIAPLVLYSFGTQLTSSFTQIF